MDGKTKSNFAKIKIEPGCSIKQFANGCINTRRESRSGIIKVELPAYCNKPIDCDASSTLFISDHELFLFPNTWDTNNHKAFGVTSYALKLSLGKRSMVELAIYSSDTQTVSKDSPSSSVNYPIEAFLTTESVHEFWVKHPVPVWSKDGDISYMRYPFWVYLSQLIRLLYSDKMSASK